MPFPSSSPAISPGSGAVRHSCSPVMGWVKATPAQCSACRENSSIGPPYSSSPSSGQPFSAMCTRIWWVRPVCRMNPTKAQLRSGAAARTRYSVTARSPSGETMRFISSGTSRSSGRSISPSAGCGMPFTTATYRLVTAFHSLPAAIWWRATTTAPVVSLSMRFTARKVPAAPSFSHRVA